LPWTALSSWPSFPPLVHEIVSLAVSQRFHNRDVLVGEPIVSPLPNASSEPLLTVEHPSGKHQRVPLSVDGESGLWRFPDTAKSGIYRAVYEPSTIGTQLYAVNVDTRESDPRRVNPDDMPAQLNRVTSIDNTEVAAVSLPGSHWSLFRIVLGSMFGLLLTETFLGWYFGNTSA
jgi:hypothetical protein